VPLAVLEQRSSEGVVRSRITIRGQLSSTLCELQLHLVVNPPFHELHGGVVICRSHTDEQNARRLQLQLLCRPGLEGGTIRRRPSGESPRNKAGNLRLCKTRLHGALIAQHHRTYHRQSSVYRVARGRPVIRCNLGNLLDNLALIITLDPLAFNVRFDVVPDGSGSEPAERTF
jgi:hypothetical protein